ncbi:MAG: sulfide/dihydroorotate dehydrogenase-like FAD/NAD-binding protein [Elusimicrobiota bacterium]
MNNIKEASWIARDIKEFKFENKLIARKFKPGQFIVVHHGEKGERIPLTIVETGENIVRVVIQKVGHSTAKLCELEEGDTFENVSGPLGKPSELKNYGEVLGIGGGIGAAPLLPVARKLKELGNKVTVIEGVRSKEYLIFKDELKDTSDRYILTSDDGSVGKEGLVTRPFEENISEGKIPDFVFAVGPPVMMRAVSEITRKHDIPLTVSLNPIMVDGTGMCGACRVEVAGETKFGCVDGPEFDGNKVNFELLIKRLNMYEEEEAETGCQLNGH